ncbi:SDR family NAD(P)-dependent oxidoreductase [Ruegeria hyattellae]|uniref:SDR family NAD(P)-dependent oxidoreductase n=1 Tax=Ruegeria hyattellae TaxID=3233337 RepID=UPI00355BA103
MLLEGRRILVTGAARGIGLAVVQACLKQGGDVLMTDLDCETLDQAAATLTEHADRLRHCRLDVSDLESIETALSGIRDWPALDGLINNAAVLDINHAGTVTDERFAHVLDTNLTGALRVTRAALPMLGNSAAPAIVNTLSTQAFFGVPRSAAYATAKGGLLMLTRSMAVDFGAEGIRVNAVAPGFINTRMALTEDGVHEHEMEGFKAHYISEGRIPLRRPGTPEDCTGAYVYLLSDLSKYVTGQVIYVDGGLSATY